MAVVPSIEQLLQRFVDRSDVQKLQFAPSSVNGDSLQRLADYIPLFSQLEVLNLAGCKQLTDREVNRLFSLPVFSLRHLDLSGCSNLTGQVGGRPSYLTRLPLLAELILDSCAITDTTLKALSTLRSLQALNISHCTAISDQGLETLLSKPGRSLKALAARECPRLTFKNLYTLRALSLEGEFVTDTTLETLAKAKYLTELHLIHCAISDKGLERFFSLSLSLTIFKIRNCPAVTGRWLRNPSAISIENLAQLKEFGFSECLYKLPKSLFQPLPRLEKLDLSNCPQLTDETAYEICVLHPYLQVYHLDGCPQVAGATLDAIQDFLNLRMEQTNANHSPHPTARLAHSQHPR